MSCTTCGGPLLPGGRLCADAHPQPLPPASPPPALGRGDVAPERIGRHRPTEPHPPREIHHEVYDASGARVDAAASDPPPREASQARVQGAVAAAKNLPGIAGRLVRFGDFLRSEPGISAVTEVIKLAFGDEEK